MADYKGRFVWYELMTSAPDAAIDFYGNVVGWGSQPFDGAGQPYTMWTNNDVPIGGVMELPAEAAAAGAPPHWLPYIGTADVDATVARALELGATVLVPAMDIPNVGRIVIVADPQGAVFAAYTPANPSEEMVSDGPPQVGQFSWHELSTTDHEAAFDFYSELFGWEKTTAMDMNEGGDGPPAIYQMYKGPSGPELGGMFNKPPEMPVAAWVLYAKVPDVKGSIESVSGSGGQVLNGPMEVPGGDMIAQCMDPQGAAFAVHSSAN